MILIGDWAPAYKKVSINMPMGITLANLEGPIIDEKKEFIPSKKAGPNIFNSHLPEVNSRFIFSLANNHIMDYGEKGLINTINILDKRGFMHVGAGKNELEARKPIIIEEDGNKIGIIGCCEAQFGLALRNSAGAAEFGPWIYRAIRNLRKRVHAVIVSVHAGVEDSPWPYPFIRELYHSFIDAGASVVHGHHAHIPQGYEVYGDGVIFYGLGNFAVDPCRWSKYPNGMWSLAAEIDFGSKPVHWTPLTFEIRYEPDSEGIMIEKSNSEEQANHDRYLEKCNRPFDNPEIFDALWHEVALRAYHHYGARYMRFCASPQEWKA